MNESPRKDHIEISTIYAIPKQNLIIWNAIQCLSFNFANIGKKRNHLQHNMYICYVSIRNRRNANKIRFYCS